MFECHSSSYAGLRLVEPSYGNRCHASTLRCITFRVHAYRNYVMARKLLRQMARFPWHESAAVHVDTAESRLRVEQPSRQWQRWAIDGPSAGIKKDTQSAQDTYRFVGPADSELKNVAEVVCKSSLEVRAGLAIAAALRQI